MLSHSYSSASFLHRTTEEWASGCVVISCHLGLNHNSPHLSSLCDHVPSWQDGLDKAQRWLQNEAYLKESLKLRMKKLILMAGERGAGWFEMRSGGTGYGSYALSWIEVTSTFLGKEGWESIAKSWVYLTKHVYNAVSNRWALGSFCRKWRSSQCYQGLWGSSMKKKRERFPHLNGLDDKRCVGEDKWTGTPM